MPKHPYRGRVVGMSPDCGGSGLMMAAESESEMTMPINVWLEKIDISDLYRDYESNGFEKTRDAIVARVRDSGVWSGDEDVERLLARLKDCSCVDDFNFFMNHLYDHADRDRVWIEGM